MFVWDFLSLNFSQLIDLFFDANKRLYFGYLGSAFLLAIPVFWYKFRSNSVIKFIKFVFPWHIYSAKSARHDYALLVTNKLIKSALFPFIILTMAPIALSVSSFFEWAFADFEHIVLPHFTIMAIFTFLLFVFDDFTRFLLHYILHKVPFLWEFHKVHHSAKVMTPFTIYRTHPVESYLYACRMAITQGIVVGFCYYLFGPNLKMLDIFGANVFVFLFNICGSNLRHSHIWLSWGDRLEGWWISPAQHHIHHSDDPKHFDANLGSALAIWDRMSNSLIRASQVKNISFGISKSHAGHHSLKQIYLEPFTHAWRQVTSSLKSSMQVKK